MPLKKKNFPQGFIFLPDLGAKGQGAKGTTKKGDLPTYHAYLGAAPRHRKKGRPTYLPPPPQKKKAGRPHCPPHGQRPGPIHPGSPEQQAISQTPPVSELPGCFAKWSGLGSAL
jgi:hypothetical protein